MLHQTVMVIILSQILKIAIAKEEESIFFGQILPNENMQLLNYAVNYGEELDLKSLLIVVDEKSQKLSFKVTIEFQLLFNFQPDIDGWNVFHPVNPEVFTMEWLVEENQAKATMPSDLMLKMVINDCFFENVAKFNTENMADDKKIYLINLPNGVAPSLFQPLTFIFQNGSALSNFNAWSHDCLVIDSSIVKVSIKKLKISIFHWSNHVKIYGSKANGKEIQNLVHEIGNWEMARRKLSQVCRYDENGNGVGDDENGDDDDDYDYYDWLGNSDEKQFEENVKCSPVIVHHLKDNFLEFGCRFRNVLNEWFHCGNGGFQKGEQKGLVDRYLFSTALKTPVFFPFGQCSTGWLYYDSYYEKYLNFPIQLSEETENERLFQTRAQVDANGVLYLPNFEGFSEQINTAFKCFKDEFSSEEVYYSGRSDDIFHCKKWLKPKNSTVVPGMEIAVDNEHFQHTWVIYKEIKQLVMQLHFACKIKGHYENIRAKITPEELASNFEISEIRQSLMFIFFRLTHVGDFDESSLLFDSQFQLRLEIAKDQSRREVLIHVGYLKHFYSKAFGLECSKLLILAIFCIQMG